MPFHSGRLSFCRFIVSGDGPTTVDDTTLATLAEHSFHETEVGAPEEVETGWVTGQHLLDTQFTYDKNGFGPTGGLLLCALRIDTHSVPSELKQAYKRVNEQALATQNPSGFASKAQKREAAETASRQLHEDLAAGKFRRSKMLPVLWDLQNRTVYCGGSGNKVIEQLSLHFFRSFNVRLEPLTPGSLAGQVLTAAKKTRDYEDFKPTAFTRPPEAAVASADDAAAGDQEESRDINVPSLPWFAAATDMKDFLGNEFLIWLWWISESAEGLIEVPAGVGIGPKRDLAIAFDKALDTDCAWGAGGKQTLRGSGPTRMPEAGKALLTGKWPRKVGLILADAAGGGAGGAGGAQWELTLQGDRWLVSGASLPEVPDARTPRELIDARLLLTRQLAETLDDLFRVFLKTRAGSAWAGPRQKIKRWIVERTERKAVEEVRSS